MLKTTDSAPASDKVLLMIRPERLTLGDVDSLDSMNLFTGTVLDSVFQGESTLLSIELPDGNRLNVRTGAGNRYPVKRGDTATVGLHAADTVLISDDV